VIWICQNDLSFSLYVMLSVCYVIVTLDEWMKSKMEVSADVGVLLLNTRDQVEWKLSSLIIILVNYSIITSLIYKLDS